MTPEELDPILQELAYRGTEESFMTFGIFLTDAQCANLPLDNDEGDPYRVGVKILGRYKGWFIYDASAEVPPDWKIGWCWSLRYAYAPVLHVLGIHRPFERYVPPPTPQEAEFRRAKSREAKKILPRIKPGLTPSEIAKAAGCSEHEVIQLFGEHYFDGRVRQGLYASTANC